MNAPGDGRAEVEEGFVEDMQGSRHWVSAVTSGAAGVVASACTDRGGCETAALGLGRRRPGRRCGVCSDGGRPARGLRGFSLSRRTEMMQRRMLRGGGGMLNSQARLTCGKGLSAANSRGLRCASGQICKGCMAIARGRRGGFAAFGRVCGAAEDSQAGCSQGFAVEGSRLGWRARGDEREGAKVC